MEGSILPKFEDWEAEKIKAPDFLAAAEELEPGVFFVIDYTDY